jgi:hypothetical protein
MSICNPVPVHPSIRLKGPSSPPASPLLLSCPNLESKLPSIHFQQMVQVIIVGGGLAGLSAAHTLLERGANVLLLDKQGYVSFQLDLFFSLTISPILSFMGGNSTKATSGINGAGTQTQQDLGIADSSKIFFEDTKRSVSILETVLLETF